MKDSVEKKKQGQKKNMSQAGVQYFQVPQFQAQVGITFI